MRDGRRAQHGKLRGNATHAIHRRSDYNSTDPAGAYRIGAHETRFGARVKGASRQVERFEKPAGLTNGFHFSVGGNIALRSDAFDSLGDYGTVAHNDRAHWNFTALASDFGEFQTPVHKRFVHRIRQFFHGLSTR